MVRLNRTPPAPNEQNKLRCNPQNITAAETRNGSLDSLHGLFIPRNEDGSYSSLYHGESTSAIHVVKTMHACTKFTATLSSVLLYKVLSKGVFSPFEYSQEVLTLTRADPDQQELPETRDSNSLYIEMDNPGETRDFCMNPECQRMHPAANLTKYNPRLAALTIMHPKIDGISHTSTHKHNCAPIYPSKYCTVPRSPEVLLLPIFNRAVYQACNGQCTA